MNQAILCAHRAMQHDDVPIGAVIVRDGKIIARGENRVQQKQNPTLHAEIVAINLLSSLAIPYSIATAISFARIRNIYFAATDEKGGGITSNARIFDTDKHLWKPNIHQIPEYANESAKMLRDFFRIRREQSKK